MVSKRLTIALVAVLVHTGAVARPECDVLRQELNQAVTDYIGAMMELTATVQELDERGCYYRIAPGDAKQIARIYTHYVKVIEVNE